MKRALLLVFCFVLNNLYAQTEFQENEKVRITLKDETIPADTITIKVKDKKTNKPALIELNRSQTESGLFVGYYILNFSKEGQLSELISNHKNLRIERLGKSESSSVSQTVAPSTPSSLALDSLTAQERLLQKQLELEKASEAEKNKRKALAFKANQQGLNFYEQKNFTEAQKKFQEAVELDPSSGEYAFRYGVSLYQNNKHQDSIHVLSTLDDESVSEAERNYFLGLNYYRLNNSEKAIQHFDKVIESEDVDISSTAAFYSGVLQFQSADYNNAKKSFEYVIDNSKDKDLDKEADAYLDKIQAAEQFEQQNKNKWKYNLFIGPVYDENILNVSSSNSPINQAGIRAYYGGSLEYRPQMTINREWTVQGAVSDMYTYSTKFKKEDLLQAADPLLLSLKSTYKIKDFNFKKPTTLTLTPGLESLMMRNTNETKRSFILNSYYLQVSPFIVQRENWYGNYNLEIRQDQSKLKEVDDVDDLNGTRYSFSTTQTYLYNKEKSRSILWDLGYSQFAAKGDNQKYNKINTALTFVSPWIWQTVASARLDYMTLTYPKHSSSRKDQILTASLNSAKPLSEKWSGSLSFSYSNSTSNVDSYDYSKFQIFNVYTYSGLF